MPRFGHSLFSLAACPILFLVKTPVLTKALLSLSMIIVIRAKSQIVSITVDHGGPDCERNPPSCVLR